MKQHVFSQAPLAQLDCEVAATAANQADWSQRRPAKSGSVQRNHGGTMAAAVAFAFAVTISGCVGTVETEAASTTETQDAGDAGTGDTGCVPAECAVDVAQACADESAKTGEPLAPSCAQPGCGGTEIACGGAIVFCCPLLKN